MFSHKLEVSIFMIAGLTELYYYDCKCYMYHMYIAVHVATSSVSMTSLVTTPPATPPVPICALSDCNNPRYVDDSGHIHECCGYTHAMEYQRRQIVQQSKSVVLSRIQCIIIVKLRIGYLIIPRVLAVQ